MREIRFRGKRVDNGGWVYGFLVRRPSAVQIGSTSPWAIIVPPSDPDDSGGEYWVVAESIGQYTGLKDKNGKEIYEGDIITTDLERPYLIVEYRNGAFMSNCNDGLEDYYDIFFGTSEEPKEVYKYGEVIGNIYENPELMA